MSIEYHKHEGESKRIKAVQLKLKVIKIGEDHVVQLGVERCAWREEKCIAMKEREVCAMFKTPAQWISM